MCFRSHEKNALYDREVQVRATLDTFTTGMYKWDERRRGLQNSRRFISNVRESFAEVCPGTRTEADFGDDVCDLREEDEMGRGDDPISV